VQNLDNTTQKIENIETINMTYTKDGLIPSLLDLKIGKAYKIIIDAQITVYGCMSTIYIP
jgi:hypothetical protein